MLFRSIYLNILKFVTKKLKNHVHFTISNIIIIVHKWHKVVESVTKWNKSGGVNRLKGTYEHNIDAKGRLFIPVKLREGLGESFIVTKGLDGCLSLYSQEKWIEMEEKISSLPLSKARSLQRYFFSSAMDCELDSQGRTLRSEERRVGKEC